MKLSDIAQSHRAVQQDRLKGLLQEINRTETDYPRDKAIPDLFSAWSANTPDAAAVLCGDTRLTYRELDVRSTQLAQKLVAAGLGTDQVAALLLDRTPWVIVAMLAILKAGGAYLPIDPDLPLERMRYMLRDSRATLLLSDVRYRDVVERLQADCARPRWVAVDGEGDPACAVDAVAASASVPRVQPRSLAYVMYTSGTTGAPKGVMVEHRSVVRLVVATNYIQLGPEDRILQTGALSFDASTFEIWGALLNGGALCLEPRGAILEGEQLKALIARHRVTVVFLTTALFNAFVAEDVAIFSGLRTVLSGGEKVSSHHFNRLRAADPQLQLKHVYGPTENTTFTTWYDVARTHDQDIPIGRPIANTTVHILDPDLEPVEIGVAGELCIGGDGLARGYLHDPALTAEKFVPHRLAPGRRLYRTGDLARWEPDGNILFLGRNDDQVKVRGYRIDPAEIVGRMLLLDGIREAFVAPREAGRDLELVAYFTAEGPMDEAALRTQLREFLPGYMIPAYFLQVDRLPLTANGKVDRRALPAPGEVRPAPALAPDRPALETEQILLGVWQQVLGRQDIGLDDDFFALGGHSLKAIKLNSQIHARLGLMLPLTQVFTAPTIRQLAQSILDAAEFGTAEIDRPMSLLNGQEGGRALFAFPPGTADALGYGDLAERLKPYAFYAFNFIEAEARFQGYADLITQAAPTGPYLLLGYSGGGNLAYHTARELERRGKRVGAVVMLDSARFLTRFRFPDTEARRLAASFLRDEDVRHYVASPVLRDKVTRIIERYYAFFSSNLDAGSIDADIHVIASQDSPDTHWDASGRVICSQSAWRDATRRAFSLARGHGGHNAMLYPPHIDGNVALLRAILDRAATADHEPEAR